MIQEGLAQVGALQLEAERARFFRLPDLYSELRGRADALASAYSGSEVEASATELVSAIDAELIELSQDLEQYERQRLESIRAGLQAMGASALSTEVEQYLQQHFQAEDR